MPTSTRRYLLIQSTIGASINFALNGLLACLLYRELASVPLQGAKSITGDTVVTMFVLPLLIALIATPAVRADRRNGRAPTLANGMSLRWLPSNAAVLGLTLGVICAAVFAPAILALLHALDISGLRFWPFVAFKAVIAALLAAFVSPVVAYQALTKASISRM